MEQLPRGPGRGELNKHLALLIPLTLPSPAGQRLLRDLFKKSPLTPLFQRGGLNSYNACLLIPHKLMEAGLWVGFNYPLGTCMFLSRHRPTKVNLSASSGFWLVIFASCASQPMIGSLAKKMTKCTTTAAGFNGINYFHGFGINYRDCIIKPISYIDMPIIGMRINPLGFITHFNQSDFF